MRLRKVLRSHATIGAVREPHLFTFLTVRRNVSALSASLLFSLVGQLAVAQNAAPNTQQLRVLSGTVTDMTGVPLSGIEISIAKSARIVRSRPDGSFRFDSIAPGTYQLQARAVGYVMQTQSITVGATDGRIVFQMMRVTQVLSANRITASRGGLSGFVGDTAYRPVARTNVTVVGGGAATTTDSLGGFFVPLRPGSYLVRFERDGFERQKLGVTIPAEEGRQVAIVLLPATSGPNHVEAVSLFELGQRMVRLTSSTAHFFSREDLLSDSIPDLQAFARRWSLGAITSGCFVSVGGGQRYTIPLASVRTADVEFVEVYQPSIVGDNGNPRGKTSMTGNPTKFAARTGTFARPGGSRDCGNLAITVWLRD